jgi:hypothetical protein
MAKPRGRRSLRPSNPSRRHNPGREQYLRYCSTTGIVARSPNPPINQPSILQSPSPRIAIHNNVSIKFISTQQFSIIYTIRSEDS